MLCLEHGGTNILQSHHHHHHHCHHQVIFMRNFFNLFPNKPWFLRIYCTSLLETCGKRRNGSQRAISPFPIVFSTRLENFLPFSSYLKYRLQTISGKKSLKFVVCDRVYNSPFDTVLTWSNIKAYDTVLTWSNIKAFDTILTWSNIKAFDTVVTWSNIKAFDTVLTWSSIKAYDTV